MNEPGGGWDVADSPEGHAAIQRDLNRLVRWAKSYEVQQEVQSPMPGEKQPQALENAGGHPAEKQLCRKGPGGHHVECDPATCPCNKEG